MPRDATPPQIVDARTAVWRSGQVQIDPRAPLRVYLWGAHKRIVALQAVLSRLEPQLLVASRHAYEEADTVDVLTGRLPAPALEEIALRQLADSVLQGMAEVREASARFNPESNRRERLLFALTYAAELRSLRDLVRALAKKELDGTNLTSDDIAILEVDEWRELGGRCLRAATTTGTELEELANLPPFDEQTEFAHFAYAFRWDSSEVAKVPPGAWPACLAPLTTPRKPLPPPEVLRQLGLRAGLESKWPFLAGLLDKWTGPRPGRRPRTENALGRAEKDAWLAFRDSRAFHDMCNDVADVEFREPLNLLSDAEEAALEQKRLAEWPAMVDRFNSNPTKVHPRTAGD